MMLQVLVDRELHKKFKMKCLAMDITMAKQIERMVESFVRGRVHAERA